MKNNNILITGGAGFIGSHLVEELLKANYNIIVVDNFSSGKLSNIPINKSIKMYEKDISSDDIEFIFEENKVDFCIHLAAQTSVSTAMQNPYKDAQTNILATIKLLQLCGKYNVKKFLTASSAAVYGTPQYLPIDEQHPTNPISFYGLSKLFMEGYIKQFGVPYLIFRFSNAYGPRQNSSSEGGVIAIFDKAMRNNAPITIYGDGNQIRDFVYVKDIANLFIKALSSDVKNMIINFSTNEGYSLNQLFEKMSKIYNYSLSPIYAPQRNGDIKESVLLNKMVSASFGQIKIMNIEEGLYLLKKWND